VEQREGYLKLCEVFHITTAQIHSGNDQLDTKLLYFIIRLLQSSTCFEERRAHYQEARLY